MDRLARSESAGPRYSFRGAVEPNVCQWASTVVPRHRVGGPRPPAKALPYATGTAMCTIYSFLLSLSCLSFSPIHSLLSLSLSLLCFAVLRPLTLVFPFPFVPPYGVIRTRETLSPSLFLFLRTGLSVSLLAPYVPILVRFSSRKFAHLVTRSNTVGCVVAAARSV